MKKISALAAITLCALTSAQGALVYTTFSIPSGSSNVGTFQIGDSTLNSLGDLSTTGSSTYAYAYRFFTPSTTGVYTLGMTDGNYDPVMILYSGQSSFPVVNPSSGAIAINDDGNWDRSGSTRFFGTQTVNPAAGGGSPSYMPLIKDQNLIAGTNYLVAISSYDRIGSGGPSSIPLPAEFFVAGAGAVALDGATAAVPEPGQVAASLLLLAGIGGYVFLKRRKVA